MTTTDDRPTVIDAQEQEEPSAAPPAVLGRSLASPQAMKAELTQQVRAWVAQQRKERGVPQTREDVFPMLRVLAGGADYLKAYGRVIRALELELRGHVEDEAGEAVGYDDDATPAKTWNGDGIPKTNLAVPDGDGEWHLTRDWDTELRVDWHSLISVQARLIADHACAGLIEGVDGVEAFEDAEQERRESELHAVAQAAAEATLDRLLFLTSAPKPKSTALTAWGKELAGKGLDQAASIVRTAWSSRRTYKGISVSRS